jgi:hypothetical protein
MFTSLSSKQHGFTFSLSVTYVCRQGAIRRALKTQCSSSAIAPHLQKSDEHSQSVAGENQKKNQQQWIP